MSLIVHLVNLHAIEQTQRRGRCRVDGVRRPKFDSTQVTACHSVPTNAVLLMKGDAWPGIKGNGLTHKSPRGQPPLPKRVLLKCDLTDFRPMLAYEDDPLLAGGGGDEEEDHRSRSRSRSRSPPPPPTPRRRGLARRGRSPSSSSS